MAICTNPDCVTPNCAGCATDDACHCADIGDCGTCAPRPRKGRNRWRVSYEITSGRCQRAEQVVTGLIVPGGGRAPLAAAQPGAQDFAFATLREALEHVEVSGAGVDLGRTIIEEGERYDAKTHVTEQRLLHPPDTITPSSYSRLLRVLHVDEIAPDPAKAVRALLAIRSWMVEGNDWREVSGADLVDAVTDALSFYGFGPIAQKDGE